MSPEPVADVLPLLLVRLWARHRARGEDPQEAAEEAAQEAARLLAVDVDTTRAVLARIPLDGASRPI